MYMHLYRNTSCSVSLLLYHLPTYLFFLCCLWTLSSTLQSMMVVLIIARNHELNTCVYIFAFVEDSVSDGSIDILLCARIRSCIIEFESESRCPRITNVISLDIIRNTDGNHTLLSLPQNRFFIKKYTRSYPP